MLRAGVAARIPPLLRAENAMRRVLRMLLASMGLIAGVAAAAPQPPVRVAVFDDGAFVDTASGGVSAESDNVQATLASLGFTVTTFVGTTEVAWRTASGNADVVLVPDLENGDLATALSENAEQALVDFVGAGGVLIVQGNASGRQTALLNTVFGFATSSGAGAATDLEVVATGTRFGEGPATLPVNNSTVSLLGFPPGTTGVYVSPLHVITVAEIAYGAGRIIFMGWDWFGAAPTGALDGGWVEVLRRAVLEGRPPTRRVAVLNDGLYVDATGGPTAESDAVQAALGSKDMLVRAFFGVSPVFWTTALGDPRRPRADVMVVPELSNADLAAVLDPNAATTLRNYVSIGGVLVVCGGTQPGRASALLNTVFSFATTAGPAVVNPTLLTLTTSNTLFSEAPATLESPSDTSTLGNLPAGAQKLYSTDGGIFGDASVVLMPYGEGKIVFLGWDFFNAAPLGPADGGWLDVLDRATRTSRPARRVAVFNDAAYVEPGEAVLNPTFAAAEALNMRASLAARGHVPRPFVGTTPAQWDAAMATAEAVVVPELEFADLAPALSPIARADIAAFVRRGGLLVVDIGQAGRGVTLVNAIFGYAMTTSFPTGPYPATPSTPGTPFGVGAASLPENNGTTGVTGLPADARAIYGVGSDAVVVWIRVGAGHVLLLGWDWFDAVPATGAQDGGWIDTLDLAVEAARPRIRQVGVFDLASIVDSAGGPSAEADTVQAALELLDHPVSTFGHGDASGLRLNLARMDAVFVPEQELGAAASVFFVDGARVLRDWVGGGGALILSGSPSSRTSLLLNSLFGFAFSNPAGAPVAPFSFDAAAALGTRFAGAPPTLSNLSAAVRVTSLPFGSRTIYAEAGGASMVTWTPYGLGRIIYLGFDYFAALPLGPQDGGWIEVLDRAVQEARPRTRQVAVFDDASYVDTALPGASEAENVKLALEAGGQAPVAFGGTSAAAWSAALAKSQALVIPELEVADLAAALPPDTRQLLRDFVARGNQLVICLDGSSRAVGLLNAVFGIPFTSADTAFDPFAATVPLPLSSGGPAQLRNLPATRALASIPSNLVATDVYDDGALGNRAVVQIRYGAGWIVTLGWDFSGHAPYEASDVGQAGWFELLRRAPVIQAPPAARRVAVLDDPAYVDTGGTSSDESDAVQASLLRLEHAVVPFTGVTQPDFETAISRADVLLVPELEVADLAPALIFGIRNDILAFVNTGGDVVVNGTNAPSGRATGFINAVLGNTALTELVSVDVAATLQPDATGTQFAGGPGSLPENNPTSGVGALPLGAKRAYVNPSGKQTVAVIPRGIGSAVYLGFDWSQAVPLGPADGGWLEILDRAVREGAGGDADGDGLVGRGDLCPQTESSANADADMDAVGDVCDSCANIANPRVADGPVAFLAANDWATLTGGQRDDDHDGYGNKCDGKFPGVTGLFVSNGDLIEWRAANTKNRTLDQCGTVGTRPCAIYDLDETGLFISNGDLIQWRTLNTKQPGPKCTTCPLPCSAGITGTCN